MNVELIYRIRNDKLLTKYLQEHSYWYKYLNRDEIYFRLFEQEMKKLYKLTPQDRINKFTDNMEMISKFINILK